jgi:hypothetical protein
MNLSFSDYIRVVFVELRDPSFACCVASDKLEA